MFVTGIIIHVSKQLVVDIYLSSSGRERMGAHGNVKYVPMQLEVVIFPSSKGQGAGCDWNSGTVYVPAQLKMGISMPSNERESMVANRIEMFAMLQLEVQVQSCRVNVLNRGEIAFGCCLLFREFFFHVVHDYCSQILGPF